MKFNLFYNLFNITDDEVQYKLIITETKFSDGSVDKTVKIKKARKSFGIVYWRFMKRATDIVAEFKDVVDAFKFIEADEQCNKKEVSQFNKKIKIY